MPAATSLPAILTTVLVIASLFSIHHAKALKISSLGSVIEGFITNNNGADASNNAESKTAQEDGGAPSSSSSSAATCSSDYFVDQSFPIHRFDDFTHDAKNSPFDKASKQKFYEEFIQGCEEKYAPEGFLCGDTELERMEMNLRQPASMRVSPVLLLLLFNHNADIECLHVPS